MKNILRYAFMEVKVPKKFILVGRAFLYGSVLQYENSLNEWKQAQNYNKAFGIFVENLLPLYFQLAFRKD